MRTYTSRVSVMLFTAVAAIGLCVEATGQSSNGLQSSDLHRLRSVVEVEFSPEGKRLREGARQRAQDPKDYPRL